MKRAGRSDFARSIVVSMTCAFVLAAPPAGAETPGYQLTLAGPSQGPPGKGFYMTAALNRPEGDVNVVSLDVDAFESSIGSCPGGYEEAYQIAARGGGGVVAHSVIVTSIKSSTKVFVPVGNTPGKYVICGYAHDTVGNTFATASHTYTVGRTARKAGGAKKGAG